MMVGECTKKNLLARNSVRRPSIDDGYHHLLILKKNFSKSAYLTINSETNHHSEVVETNSQQKVLEAADIPSFQANVTTGAVNIYMSFSKLLTEVLRQ